MMMLAIVVMVTAPAVGQTLLDRPNLGAAVYPFSWAMYSR